MIFNINLTNYRLKIIYLCVKSYDMKWLTLVCTKSLNEIINIFYKQFSKIK